MFFKRSLLIVFSLVFCIAAAHAASGEGTDDPLPSFNAPIFPQMLFSDTINNVKRFENSKPYWVNTKEEFEHIKKLSDYQISLLMNHDILAYYGHPGSRNMGILGRHTI